MKNSVLSSTCVAAWVVFAALLGDGCAEGYGPIPSGALLDGPGSGSGDVDDSSVGGSQGAAGAGAGSDPGMSIEPAAEDPTTDECARGETDVCLCAATATEGNRVCLANAASSSDGYFGACENCKAKAPAPSTTPAPGTTPPAAGCTAMPTMCTALLQCCKPDGKCGIGLAPLCL